tara:strand:- start:3702 stop:5204 length:1503 start_codon:yes stop_codon:yes gene_type:complete
MAAYLRKFTLVLIGIFFALSSNGLTKDRLEHASFGDVNNAKASAEAVNAGLFAPKSFKRALEKYEYAKNNMQQDSIQNSSNNFYNIVEHFNTATQVADLAKDTLSQSIKSRQEGANMNAPSMSPKIWKKAQQKFMRSIQALESGNLKKTKTLEAEAITLYRQAELVAIKKKYLGETWQFLGATEKANKSTPITFAKARKLIKEAENIIEKKQDNEALLKHTINRANFEIEHAQYLSKRILQIKDKKISLERLLLNWEQNLWKISEIANIRPNVKEETNDLTNKLVSHFKSTVTDMSKMKQEIQALQLKVDTLSQEKIENSLRISDMNKEIRSLDNQLSDELENKSNLIQILESQARVKEQFVQIEKLFLPQEARIFRESDAIILRLFGLNFDSGTAKIKLSSIDLLNKVKKAIDIFPQSEVIINGHTDSQGSIKNNQDISQERAEAIREYMIDKMQIPRHQLIALGYGETKPVSSNETEAGRSRNRRIDILIRPNINMSD